MSCDIHMTTEIKVRGKWREAPPWAIQCFSCDGAGKYGERAREELRGTACDWCGGTGKEMVTGYNWRSYNLFAILADVRNGRGFAGVKTGEGFVPIAEPRGVPKDASAAYKKMVEDYGEDGHSHSWHTLAQLEAYDWARGAVLCGVIPVSAEASPFKSTTYAEFVASGRKQPESWSAGISGPGIVVMEERDYQKALGKGTLPEGRIFVRVSWKQSYVDSVPKDWFEETLPALRALAKQHGGPDNVRIVFYFDN